MKTYRSDQHGFEIDIPENWSFHSEGSVSHPLGKDRSLIFKCGPNEAFNIQIGALTPEPTLQQTESKFRRYAEEKGYTSLGFGRVTAGEKSISGRVITRGVVYGARNT